MLDVTLDPIECKTAIGGRHMCPATICENPWLLDLFGGVQSCAQGSGRPNPVRCLGGSWETSRCVSLRASSTRRKYVFVIGLFSVSDLPRGHQPMFTPFPIFVLILFCGPTWAKLQNPLEIDLT